MDHNSLATVLLTGRLGGGEARPLKSMEYWKLCDQVGSPEAVLGLAVGDLVSRFGLHESLASQVVALVERAPLVAAELEQLEQDEISPLTHLEESFPQRILQALGKKAPPLLFVAGSTSLFSRRGLGVVGSREVSEAGAEVAREAAGLAARQGFTVVSGAARGVDQLAMLAAREAGGSVVGILADSLRRALRDVETMSAVQEGKVVLCTPYRPTAPFSVGNAMGRNKLIYGQACLTLVVASDRGEGGTWSGATEALRGGFGRVAVWRGAGEGPGNGPLEELGAHPLRRVSDLEAYLTEVPEASASPAPTVVDQQTLFD